MSNQLELIKSPERLLEWWPDMMTGLPEFCAVMNRHVSQADFAQTVLKIMNNPEGLVGILHSKNGKFLGYGLAYASTDPDGTRSMFVYYTYSNQKCATTVKELFEHCTRYARQMGIRQMSAVSPRTSGAALRWFEKRMKFRRAGLLFTQAI